MLVSNRVVFKIRIPRGERSISAEVFYRAIGVQGYWVVDVWESPSGEIQLLVEAPRVFDPEPLKEIIAELNEHAEAIKIDLRLSAVSQVVTAFDGTLVSALPRMAAVSLLKQASGSGMVKWRLHTHFEVLRGLPTRIEVTPNGGGDASVMW